MTINPETAGSGQLKSGLLLYLYCCTSYQVTFQIQYSI